MNVWNNQNGNLKLEVVFLRWWGEREEISFAFGVFDKLMPLRPRLGLGYEAGAPKTSGESEYRHTATDIFLFLLHTTTDQIGAISVWPETSPSK